MTRSYSELRKIKSFKDRYDYLKLNGVVGASTFGYDRYINQALYKSPRWMGVRDQVIIRDGGCDLAHPDYEINDVVVIHHINPITARDIETGHKKVFDMENLVCTSERTHQAIHFGNENMIPKPIVERSRNDTSPWKKE
jgi:hypothetical protein